MCMSHAGRRWACISKYSKMASNCIDCKYWLIVLWWVIYCVRKINPNFLVAQRNNNNFLSHGFCQPGIQTEHSRDIWPLLLHVGDLQGRLKDWRWTRPEEPAHNVSSMVGKWELAAGQEASVAPHIVGCLGIQATGILLWRFPMLPRLANTFLFFAAVFSNCITDIM